MRFWQRGNRGHVGTVAFNMKPVKGPWGGSSPFVVQFATFLERLGYRVTYRLEPGTDVVVLIDPRTDLPNKPFGPAEIASFRKSHPRLRVLHRVNECDGRKGTDFMDNLLAEANGVADATVFISRWVRDYHAERWFDASRHHEVIYNAADRAVFHPVGGAVFDGTGPLRIVTHHWSDNPLKGFDVYRQVDRELARGKLGDTEFWVVGRWPGDIRWQAAKTVPPLAGKDLADTLRSCHVYLTASRWEPCGMHHVEGAQCGLPLIYHEDGGGIVEAGERYGVGFRNDVSGALSRLRERYGDYRRRVFDQMPSGDRMCAAYADIVQKLMCGCCDEEGRPATRRQEP
jgi:glycosyltransferase involved in cell wall biosynthesis